LAPIQELLAKILREEPKIVFKDEKHEIEIGLEIKIDYLGIQLLNLLKYIL
jgi:hypothetical protein